MVQRTEGVDGLGCQVQRRGPKLLMTPQKQTGQARLQEVRSWLQTHRTVAADVVIRQLHPLLRGWVMYDRPGVGQHTVPNVDDHLWRARWRWATRRHPKKPKRGVYRRDFEGGQSGATCSPASQDRRGKTLRLRLDRMPAIPIVRHVKVNGRASPDDPTLNASGDRVSYQVFCCLALDDTELVASRLEEANIPTDSALALGLAC
jgi:RNA-directed DNA polymerase